MPTEISYYEAWRLWSEAQPIGDKILFGLQVIWWGRIGKIVQFLSAITIVAELVGEEKLLVFSQKFEKANVIAVLKYAIYATSKGRGGMLWVAFVMLSSAYVFFNVETILITIRKTEPFAMASYIIIMLIIFVLFVISLGVLFILFNSLISVLALLMSRVAAIMSSKKQLSIFVLLLLLLGFHFDLLAS